jgi:hypothetical protein
MFTFSVRYITDSVNAFELAAFVQAIHDASPLDFRKALAFVLFAPVRIEIPLLAFVECAGRATVNHFRFSYSKLYSMP